MNTDTTMPANELHSDLAIEWQGRWFDITTVDRITRRVRVVLKGHGTVTFVPTATVNTRPKEQQ